MKLDEGIKVKDEVLLIGNDINNGTNGNSWFELLNSLNHEFSLNVDFSDKEKPFPLAYEEFYFKAAISTGRPEKDVLDFISKKVYNIQPNEIHKLLLSLGTETILTTNYDLSLELELTGKKLYKNTGIVLESTYNLFRKNKVKDRTIWHIHGVASLPSTIVLGYGHYSGYLQHMRNYVVTGTKDQYKNLASTSLIKLLKSNAVEYYSWIDYFFTKNIHIMGLSLDFIEIGLWWILTYRRKVQLGSVKSKINICNKVFYYTPKMYVNKSKAKISDGSPEII